MMRVGLAEALDPMPIISTNGFKALVAFAFLVAVLGGVWFGLATWRLRLASLDDARNAFRPRTGAFVAPAETRRLSRTTSPSHTWCVSGFRSGARVGDTVLAHLSRRRRLFTFGWRGPGYGSVLDGAHRGL